MVGDSTSPSIQNSWAEGTLPLFCSSHEERRELGEDDIEASGVGGPSLGVAQQLLVEDSCSASLTQKGQSKGIFYSYPFAVHV
jgi:hypothetical protein